MMLIGSIEGTVRIGGSLSSTMVDLLKCIKIVININKLKFILYKVYEQRGFGVLGFWGFGVGSIMVFCVVAFCVDLGRSFR